MSEREENGKERTNERTGDTIMLHRVSFFKYTILQIYFGTEKSVSTNVRHLVLFFGIIYRERGDFVWVDQSKLECCFFFCRSTFLVVFDQGKLIIKGKVHFLSFRVSKFWLISRAR